MSSEPRDKPQAPCRAAFETSEHAARVAGHRSSFCIGSCRWTKTRPSRWQVLRTRMARAPARSRTLRARPPAARREAGGEVARQHARTPLAGQMLMFVSDMKALVAEQVDLQ